MYSFQTETYTTNDLLDECDESVKDVDCRVAEWLRVEINTLTTLFRQIHSHIKLGSTILVPFAVRRAQMIIHEWKHVECRGC